MSCSPTAVSRTCGPRVPADADSIRALHARSSAKTLYLRYFSPASTVSDRTIEIFTDVDYDSRVGLVAVLGGEIIAAGTYHRDPVGDTDAAEVSLPTFSSSPSATSPVHRPGRRPCPTPALTDHQMLVTRLHRRPQPRSAGTQSVSASSSRTDPRKS
ncbi:MAG TPA: hypothetical protein VES60_08565 [Nakamurella sp.]|nr:hypothetical protein [Nakamurella sp.]